jgi:hypothetical protein
MKVVLTIGSCAIETHEPGQIRKEAAISGHFCVLQGCLVRANYMSNAWLGVSRIGARHNLYTST